MLRASSPLMISPPSYELMFGFMANIQRWCKLSDVCDLVPELTRIAETDFKPTPEDLVSRFASLMRNNKIPGGLRKIELENQHQTERADRPRSKTKIFRYSLDGTGFSGTTIPTEGFQAPPYAPFFLPIETPYPKTLFVPEEWAVDTLYAIRRGAVAAADFGETQVGFPPRTSKSEIIHLGGKREMFLVKLPECV